VGLLGDLATGQIITLAAPKGNYKFKNTYALDLLLFDLII
jgi:hypothetical protein